MKYIKFYDKWIDNDIQPIWLNIKTLFKRPVKDEKVEYWFLEVNENGSINREIAIGENGQIISIAPYKSNRGMWVDSLISVKPDQYKSITEGEFLGKWEMAMQTL